MIYASSMVITKEQYQKIEPFLPVPRGNCKDDRHHVVNVMLHMTENGCKWRGLPSEFGNWHTLYTRIKRWTEKGVWERAFEAFRGEGFDITKFMMDATIVKAHPDAAGALKKKDLNTLGEVVEG